MLDFLLRFVVERELFPEGIFLRLIRRKCQNCTAISAVLPHTTTSHRTGECVPYIMVFDSLRLGYRAGHRAPVDAHTKTTLTKSTCVICGKRWCGGHFEVTIGITHRGSDVVANGEGIPVACTTKEGPPVEFHRQCRGVRVSTYMLRGQHSSGDTARRSMGEHDDDPCLVVSKKERHR